MPSTTRGAEKREIWALKMAPSEKAEIKARAQARDMTMTEYMVRSALGSLDVDPTDIEQELERVKERVARLERVFDEQNW